MCLGLGQNKHIVMDIFHFFSDIWKTEQSLK